MNLHVCAKFGPDRTTGDDVYTVGRMHTQTDTHTLLYRLMMYFLFQMSSSLRERLKRSSRFFKSPAASKRLCQPNTETQESPPSGTTPHHSASSSLVPETTSPVSSDSPDGAKSGSYTACSIIEEHRSTVSNSGNDLSMDIHKHSNTFSEEKHFDDRTPHTAESSYNKTLSTDSCRTPTQKLHRNSGDDFVSPSLCVTPCKSVDAAKCVVITPVRQATDSIDDNNTFRTPCRSNFDTPCSSDTPGGPITPSGHLGDVEAGLKKQRAALLERIAKQEERLRQLKMVKMYRNKVGGIILLSA